VFDALQPDVHLYWPGITLANLPESASATTQAITEQSSKMERGTSSLSPAIGLVVAALFAISKEFGKSVDWRPLGSISYDLSDPREPADYLLKRDEHRRRHPWQQANMMPSRAQASSTDVFPIAETFYNGQQH